MAGRRKTTSKMPVDVPVTDVPEDSSPSATDHDFVSFVRSTLSALNSKMDDLLSNQAAFESTLELIERRVTLKTIARPLFGKLRPILESSTMSPQSLPTHCVSLNLQVCVYIKINIK